MQRREFLQASAGLTAASFAGAQTAKGDRFVTPASTPAPGIVDIANRRQLFLDDLLIDEASRISKFVARPRKHADNPIIVRDKPWEAGNLGGHFEGVEITGQTVIYDEEERLFKMWYVPWPWEDGRRPWCYAVSTDGFSWENQTWESTSTAGRRIIIFWPTTATRIISMLCRTRTIQILLAVTRRWGNWKERSPTIRAELPSPSLPTVSV